MSHLLASSVAAAVAVTAATGAASADSGEPALGTTRHAPLFTHLDPTAAPSHVGAVMSLGFDDDDLAVTRIDVNASYRHPLGVGGYFRTAVSRTSIEDNGEPHNPAIVLNDEIAVAAIEVGGLYHRALGEAVELATHVGLALPTAFRGESHEVNLISTRSRPQDLALAIPETTWLRLGVTPTVRLGPVFVRADVGADLVLAGDEMSTLDPIAHGNLGLGYVHRRVAVSAELVTLMSTGTLDEGAPRFHHVAALGAELRGNPRVVPHLAVSTALDDDRAPSDRLAIFAGIKAGY